jgi:hypothetical protein
VPWTDTLRGAFTSLASKITSPLIATPSSVDSSTNHHRPLDESTRFDDPTNEHVLTDDPTNQDDRATNQHEDSSTNQRGVIEEDNSSSSGVSNPSNTSTSSLHNVDSLISSNS